MATRPPLSVVIITLNEERNLPRCLESTAWAAEVVVVDSGSTDGTRQIAEKAGAKVLHHSWEGYGQQKNWALAQTTQPWVLFLDADEEVTHELREEIAAFLSTDGRVGSEQFHGAHFPRKTKFLGRWILHGGWYPNRLVRLVRKQGASWTEPAVHESLQAAGPICAMSSDLLHYTFRTVGDQVLTNVRFAKLGSKVAKARGENGSLLKILGKPIGKFFETYVWKRGFLDGFPGFVISINAAHSIFMKYVELRLEENSDHR